MRFVRRVGAGLAAVVASVALVTSTASAAPGRPKEPEPLPVIGIPKPCKQDLAYPDGLSIKQVKSLMEKKWKLKLLGDDWSKEEFAPIIRLMWESLDAIDCTPFLDETRKKISGPLVINATKIDGYAWGDWGLTKPGAMSVDFAKLQKGYDDEEFERVVRVFIHELSHVQSVDRGGYDGYWSRFKALDRSLGPISTYAGRNDSENYAEMVAYYVTRCTPDNPYNTKKFAAYYSYVRKEVFGGKEFGPKPGTKPQC